MLVPFLRPFPGNEAHKFFSGGPKWGILGGWQKVYVEKVYVLFLSLRCAASSISEAALAAKAPHSILRQNRLGSRSPETPH